MTLSRMKLELIGAKLIPRDGLETGGAGDEGAAGHHVQRGPAGEARGARAAALVEVIERDGVAVGVAAQRRDEVRARGPAGVVRHVDLVDVTVDVAADGEGAVAGVLGGRGVAVAAVGAVD